MDHYGLFRDRADAGKRLAQQLGGQLVRYCRESGGSVVLLGLPRGGVVVASEVARRLRLPVDCWVVRKVGAPLQPELGIGAVAEGGEIFLNADIMTCSGATVAEVEAEVRRQLVEVDERVRRYRHGHPPPDLRNRTVVLVDDGIATGGTALAAAHAVRKRGAQHLLVAAPVAASDAIDLLGSEPAIDEIVCLQVEPDLSAIGAFYINFAPVSDLEVARLLDRGYACGTRAEGPHGV